MADGTLQSTRPEQALAWDPEHDILQVRRRLAEVLRNSLPDVEHIATHPSLVGGKMLRARLLLATTRALFTAPRADAIDLAVVLELAHLATLLHDDVIDAEAVRRHAGTFRADMGNRSSVLAGDFVLTRAVVLLSSSYSPACVQIVAQAVSAVLEGELVQNDQCGNLDLHADRYLEIIRLKTGTLFRTACELGALGNDVLGSADGALLAEAGLLLGTAYQLADDYADYFGDLGKLGKPMGRDYAAGVVTLPLIHAMSRSEEIRQEAGRSCGRGPVPVRTLQRLVGKMRRQGTDAYVRERVAASIDTAADHVARLEGRGVGIPPLMAYIGQFSQSVTAALLAL